MHRLGGYKLMFFGSQLVPYAPAELRRIYGSFESYRDAVNRTVVSEENPRACGERGASSSRRVVARAAFPGTIS